ncbi:hypothetical protein WAI453_008830 [Rhynchosporium graminicola]
MFTSTQSPSLSFPFNGSCATQVCDRRMFLDLVAAPKSGICMLAIGSQRNVYKHIFGISNHYLAKAVDGCSPNGVGRVRFLFANNCGVFRLIFDIVYLAGDQTSDFRARSLSCPRTCSLEILLCKPERVFSKASDFRTASLSSVAFEFAEVVCLFTMIDFMGGALERSCFRTSDGSKSGGSKKSSQTSDTFVTRIGTTARDRQNVNGMSMILARYGLSALSTTSSSDVSRLHLLTKSLMLKIRPSLSLATYPFEERP